MPKIAQIRHSAIFRKNRFFHVFKVFEPRRAQKIDFDKIFELAPKTVSKGVFRQNLRFSGRKTQKKPI